MCPPPSDDRCGSRSRRGLSEHDHSTVAGGDALTLSAAGRALLDALATDERYRDLIADPFDPGHGAG
jgi:hypothetical protein